MPKINEVETIVDAQIDELERALNEVIRDVANAVDEPTANIGMASYTAFGVIMARYARALINEVRAGREVKH